MTVQELIAKLQEFPLDADVGKDVDSGGFAGIDPSRIQASLQHKSPHRVAGYDYCEKPYGRGCLDCDRGLKPVVTMVEL